MILMRKGAVGGGGGGYFCPDFKMAAPTCLSGGELGHVAEVAFLHLPG
jgi:hypothetical protein